jgi:hypothetical protein
MAVLIAVLASGITGGCNAMVGIEEGVLCSPPGTDCETIAGTDGAVSCSDCALHCLPPWQIEDPMSGHCYLLERMEKKQWSSAEELCRGIGGTLAAITSDREIGLAGTLIRESTWIGGTDLAIGDTYTWSNGEPWWLSAPWVNGEPNSGDDKHCVRVSSEPVVFENAKCGTKLSYLCEKG